MYIVGMNGPPRCGKNTLAHALADRIALDSVMPTLVMSLSEPMGRAAAGMLGVTYSEEWYEREKDVIQPVLGVTLREWIIANSETFMKPVYGNDIWVRLFWQAVPPSFDGVLICVNFGFQHEPEFFEIMVGSMNVLTVQIEREGHDFSADSRGLVGGLNIVHAKNDGDEESIPVLAGQLYAQMVNQLHWKL